MGRKSSQFLALTLFFGTVATTTSLIPALAFAAPKGDVKEYGVQTAYRCHTNGVLVRNGDRLVSRGSGDDFKFVAKPGTNQILKFGHREYLIWPRVSATSFQKNLNVLVKDETGKFNVIQEIGLGDAQKTKTSVALTVREGTAEEKPVTCAIEMEWVKKPL